MIMFSFLRRSAKRREAMEYEALKKTYQSVFSGPAGQRVLADLCTSVKLVQNASGGHLSMADARAFAAGQQDVILRIMRMVEE